MPKHYAEIPGWSHAQELFDHVIKSIEDPSLFVEIGSYFGRSGCYMAELIKENPEIGRIVPEFSNIKLREIIIKNYRIVYRIKKENIEILTVFESHRLIRRDELLDKK